MLREPAKDEEPVPETTTLPPMEAFLTNSKLLETLALVAVKRLTPVILLELAVRVPPKVKALMVRVPELVDWIVLVPPPWKVKPPPERVLINVPLVETSPVA